jgi:predicted Zn-dependent protease
MSRRVGMLLLPVLAGCELATPPDRSETYPVAPRLENGFPILFRWPTASLPVRVWAEPVMDLPHHVDAAIATWQAAFLYGELRGIRVEDSADADVVIRLADPEALRLRSDRPNCSASTRIEVDLDTAIILPFRTRLAPRLGASLDDVQSCFETLVAHEMGHVLGLFLHSDDPGDLMHARPATSALSARDVATLHTLYHTTPTIRLPPGR